MKLVERREFDGTAELNGVRRNVSLLLVPDAVLGDHVLVHAGSAITIIDAEEARRTLELIDSALRSTPDA